MLKLPEKKYFKIGEVADIVGVEPHVLRYWETQFPNLRPHKARSGHRLYRRREVETLLVIRELLHVQRFTIAGARQALRQPGGAASLVPRFFGDPAPDGAAIDGAAIDGDGATLVPQSADAGATDPDGEVSVEAVGLSDDDELRDALEREAAERAAPGRALVAVDVEPEPPPAPRPAAPRPAAPVPVRAAAMAPAMGLARAARSQPGRDLLESALGDARAILALLDRDDAAARMHRAL